MHEDFPVSVAKRGSVAFFVAVQFIHEDQLPTRRRQDAKDASESKLSFFALLRLCVGNFCSCLNAAQPVLPELHGKCAEGSGVQRFANFLHEVEVIVQVVNARQHWRQHFTAALQVMQIGA